MSFTARMFIASILLLSLLGTSLASNQCQQPGECLSEWGFCGRTVEYCGKGCQGGACWSPPQSSTSSIKSAGNSCCPSSPSLCKSKYGFCGSGDAYCGDGCQCGACTGKPTGGDQSAINTFVSTTTATTSTVIADTGKTCQAQEDFNSFNTSSANFKVDYCAYQYQTGVDGAHARLKMDKTCGTRISTPNFYKKLTVEARMKVANSPGVVTAFILRSVENQPQDEIDFEWVTRNGSAWTMTNFFVDSVIDYTNAVYHPFNVDVSQGFYDYKIEWTGQEVRWFVNGQLIRELKRDGRQKPVPTRPMRVEIGIWDGTNTSGWAGTTDFSKAPFNVLVDRVKLSYAC